MNQLKFKFVTVAPGRFVNLAAVAAFDFDGDLAGPANVLLLNGETLQLTEDEAKPLARAIRETQL